MRVPVSRVLLLLALGLAPAALSYWLAVEALRAWSAWSGPGQAVDAAVVAATAGAGAVVAGWLALGALVSGACVLAGSTQRPALVPVPLHRCVALVLGVALAATLDPAWAPTGPGEAAAPVRTAVAEVAGAAASRTGAPDPGWRPVQAPTPSPRTVAEPIDPILLSGSQPGTPSGELSGEPAGELTEPVTVHRGDTLWDLAARHLGGRATDAEIAAEWPRWYAANREAIGADPDLLLPGQQLAPPGPVDGG